MKLIEAIPKAYREGNHIMVGRIADQLRAEGATHEGVEQCFEMCCDPFSRRRLANLLLEADEEEQSAFETPTT